MLGWYAVNVSPLATEPARAIKPRYIPGLGVTGQTNPDTAAIGFRQRLADGTEINDEVRLVRDQHGTWSRVFGRDRACIEAPIERFGEDAEPR